jgi:hypothetical protein
MKHKQHDRRLTKFVLISLTSTALMMLAASVSSAQVCESCIPIPRADFELAKKAVDEVKASRVVIDKQIAEIDLLRENVALKDQVIGLLKENIALRDQQSAEKDKQIAGEKAARETTEKQLTIETKEKEKAQRSAKFWRKVGTMAGAAAGVLIFGVLH